MSCLREPHAYGLVAYGKPFLRAALGLGGQRLAVDRLSVVGRDLMPPFVTGQKLGRKCHGRAFNLVGSGVSALLDTVRCIDRSRQGQEVNSVRHRISSSHAAAYRHYLGHKYYAAAESGKNRI